MGDAAILITGGAGFIGAHLAERLLAGGARVVLLDNFDPFYDPRIKRAAAAALLAGPRCRLVEGDIRDAALLDRVLAAEGVDRVVHLAARAGVRPSIAEPALYASVNLEGTASVLEACRRRGVSRVIFGSSSSVYGNAARVPFRESDPVDRPVSPYAATKRGGELLCHAWHHLHGGQVACLRFFTVYGPRQRPEMAIHRFAAELAAGREIEQFGDGRTARDYTYVSDIVEGIVRALERMSGYHVWNLGGSRTITLEELIRALAERLGVPARVRRLPPQPGDVERTFADIELARRELDWAPAVSLEEGLDRFVAWWRREAAARTVGPRA